MSSLSMTEAKLPPGFRFYPRDDELVCDYLAKKSVDGNLIDGDGAAAAAQPFMIDIDFNKCEPWDLPEIACVGGKEWYFFSVRDKKYATGHRTNRATKSGYWKATGKDRPVARGGELVGMRKTLVFYQGRAPKGHKTDWVMHEFRNEPAAAAAGRTPLHKVSHKEDWVLCRVFYKNRGVSFNNTSIEMDESATPPPTPPPLIDHTFNSFDHVPCLSNPPPTHPTPTTHHPFGLQKLDPFMNQTSKDEEDEDEDKKMVKVVWDHIAKMEEGPTSNIVGWAPPPPPPQPPKSFHDVGLPSLWNPFGYYL